jgi:hypothetical protein
MMRKIDTILGGPFEHSLARALVYITCAVVVAYVAALLVLAGPRKLIDFMNHPPARFFPSEMDWS